MMKKKCVWYISKYANITKYGAETRQASFCKEFSKKGFDVKLITSNSSHLYSTLPKINGRYLLERSEGFDVIWVNTPQYARTTSIKRIISWIWFELFVISLPFFKKYQKPDVVIASSLSLISVFSGCFFKFFYKSKFIFEVRDIWPQSIIDLKGISAKHPLIFILALIEKLGYKYADKIVGTMPGLAVHVEEIIGKNRKVNFIPQGVSLDFYRKEQQEIDDDYIHEYIPKDKFIVTYAGTIGVANALEHVVSAAKFIDKKGNNIHFLFIGNGSEEDVLKAKAKGLTNITFAPRVVKEKIQSILNRSDILIASVKNEKVYRFGISLNKFIDYMFAKKPIICMFSGYPSMINEANCGEFTPSENPIAFANKILEYAKMSKRELQKIGVNGHQFLVEERNFHILSEQYIGLFND
jgi:glycosyltransferase involved in cell wall biosynthesis